MTFFWTTDLGPFFFKGVNVDSVTSMAIACAVCALLAIAYEGIKVSGKYLMPLRNILILWVFSSNSRSIRRMHALKLPVN